VFEERRAVSETLGFVFAFALIVTTTGLVFTLGQGGLQNAQDQERLNNAERAMDVLAQNMNDLNRRSVPSRATEIRLSEASIGYGDPVRFNVTLEGTDSGNSFSSPYPISVTPIVYRGGPNGDTHLVYSNGAVIRDQPDGEVTIVRPNFQLTGEAVILPVIKTVATGDRSRVGGSTTVLVRGRVPSTPTSPASSNLLVARSPDQKVTVTVNMTSPRATAWKRTFERQDATCGPVTNGNFTSCSVRTDRVSVSFVRVFVALE
jgi:hypothetical protein